ncbi:18.1 kDa class I heat shock protein-like [Neltuma alba]|uniref:18.1 kDa class I heat shock protein-like n=1 Tax=Neltuma alba TaxID=207710 RepID=UPI0010A449C8|nr:18.1 kDa class I heat shock protein-like [Prosopis alba]
MSLVPRGRYGGGSGYGDGGGYGGGSGYGGGGGYGGGSGYAGGGGYGNRRNEPSVPQIRNGPYDDPELHTALTSNHIEWKDNPEAHVYKVHLPGLRPDEVKVEVEEDERVVIITGEKKLEREERKGNWYQMERSTGRMVQRLSLPQNAKMSQVKAYMDGGVLTVTVPKYEVANYYNQARRPRLINISGN